MKKKNTHRAFSHLSDRGAARMVDVSGKAPSVRMARAEAFVEVGNEIAGKLRRSGNVDKGNVLETARISGILAAKHTSELIPMCHPLALDDVAIEAKLQNGRVRIESLVRCTGRTGVEMEAMVAVAVAALTVYDMVKSAGKGVRIGPVQLLEKRGGKSGTWKR